MLMADLSGTDTRPDAPSRAYNRLHRFNRTSALPRTDFVAAARPSLVRVQRRRAIWKIDHLLDAVSRAPHELKGEHPAMADDLPPKFSGNGPRDRAVPLLKVLSRLAV